MNAIEINKISKSYKKVSALEDIDFSVSKGELFGLIGPDGAGKTSLIRILTTLIKSDSGEAKVMGLDVVKDYKKIRSKIGYMPGVFALYQDLTIQENLSFFATVFGGTIHDNYDLIAPIYEQIEAFKDRRAGKLSGGMKQKLALSCALIHRPEVLFLDEPTTGVDAVSRQEFWDMLKEMKKHGITVFVSTPYMDEATQCDRVALIQKSRILDIDNPEKITSKFNHHLLKLRSNKRYQLLKDLRKLSGISAVYPFGAYTHLSSKEKLDQNKIRTYLENNGHESIVIEETLPDIEDRFIELMNP